MAWLNLCEEVEELFDSSDDIHWRFAVGMWKHVLKHRKRMMERYHEQKHIRTLRGTQREYALAEGRRITECKTRMYRLFKSSLCCNRMNLCWGASFARVDAFKCGVFRVWNGVPLNGWRIDEERCEPTTLTKPSSAIQNDCHVGQVSPFAKTEPQPRKVSTRSTEAVCRLSERPFGLGEQPTSTRNWRCF